MATDGREASRAATRHAMVELLPRLRRFCLALTGTSADADDLCQSTCERAIVKMHLWTPGTRLDSWLYRMAQNLHRNAIRDQTNRLRLLDERALLEPELQQEPIQSASPVDHADLKVAMLALPEPQREVLWLVCIEGYSYDECAEMLAIPKTTVTNRLYQARSTLRDSVNQATDMKQEENAEPVLARSVPA